MPDIPELSNIRETIDGIDNRILDLLAERSRVVAKVAILKTELGMQAHQPDRFGALKERLHALAAQQGLDPALIDGVWGAIHDSSLAQQTAPAPSPISEPFSR